MLKQAKKHRNKDHAELTFSSGHTLWENFPLVYGAVCPDANTLKSLPAKTSMEQHQWNVPGLGTDVWSQVLCETWLG